LYGVDAIRLHLFDVSDRTEKVRTACIILCGAHESGKTYSLLGDEARPGILSFLSDRLFQDSDAVSVSQVELGAGKECLDLLSGSRQVECSWSNKKCQLNPTVRVAHSRSEILEIARKGYQQREMFSSHVTPNGVASHLATEIRCENKTILLLELGSVMASQRTDDDSDFVAASMQTLGRVLKALKKKDSEAAQKALEEHAKTSTLLQVFSRTALEEESRTMLFATLSPGDDSIKATERVVQFCKHFRFD
jgi:hypothetical protein